MNEKARIAAIKAGAAPSLNDWLEASTRPKLRKVLEVTQTQMTRAERISRNLQRLNKAQQERDARDAIEEKEQCAAALARMKAKS